MLLTEPAFEGELPHEGSRDIAITAVNTGAFTMPFTGSTGFTAVSTWLGACALCLVYSRLFGAKKENGGGTVIYSDCVRLVG